jgi:hypothetical protein
MGLLLGKPVRCQYLGTSTQAGQACFRQGSNTDEFRTPLSFDGYKWGAHPFSYSRLPSFAGTRIRDPSTDFRFWLALMWPANASAFGLFSRNACNVDVMP